MKFKVGQTVRCITDSNTRLSMSKMYYVHGVCDNPGNQVQVEAEGGLAWFPVKFFEVLSESC